MKVSNLAEIKIRKHIAAYDYEFIFNILFGKLNRSGSAEIFLRYDVLYFYSDVGGGIIANNDLFWGSSWSAGEIQLNLDNTEGLALEPWVEKTDFFKMLFLDINKD